MSGERFENSIHRIIVMYLMDEENSIPSWLSEVWLIKCGEMYLDNQSMKSVLALKIFKSIHKKHLRCFIVNTSMPPCFQIRFFFVRSRGAPVLAKDIHLQVHGIFEQ